MAVEPITILAAHYGGDIPEELIATVDFVFTAAPREMYLDGYQILTTSEARERRKWAGGRVG